VAQLEHVPDLDRLRDVADAEVVALAAVNTDGGADHAQNRRSRRSRQLVAFRTGSRCFVSTAGRGVYPRGFREFFENQRNAQETMRRAPSGPWSSCKRPLGPGEHEGPQRSLLVADVGSHDGHIERAQIRTVMPKVGVPRGDNDWHRRDVAVVRHRRVRAQPALPPVAEAAGRGCRPRSARCRNTGPT
jgi:hypothetical protein